MKVKELVKLLLERPQEGDVSLEIECNGVTPYPSYNIRIRKAFGDQTVIVGED